MKIYNLTFDEAPTFLELKEEAKKVDKNSVITIFDGAVNTYQTQSKRAAEAITTLYKCALEVIEAPSGIKGGTM